MQRRKEEIHHNTTTQNRGEECSLNKERSTRQMTKPYKKEVKEERGDNGTPEKKN